MTVFVSSAQDPRQPPRFEDYPVAKIFSGTPAAPVLDTAEARMFRTRIRDGVAKFGKPPLPLEEEAGEPFAGHYIVVQWQFGGPGMMGVMSEAVSGKLHHLPLFDGLQSIDLVRGDPPCNYWWGPGSIEFRKDSRLMIVEGSPERGTGKINYRHYFLWENEKWRLLDRVAMTCPK
jgi:hypothetical protein